MFSLDTGVVFDPFDLSIDITPESVRQSLQRKEYTLALIMSIRLNEYDIIVECIEAVPPTDGK